MTAAIYDDKIFLRDSRHNLNATLSESASRWQGVKHIKIKCWVLWLSSILCCMLFIHFIASDPLLSSHLSLPSVILSFTKYWNRGKQKTFSKFWKLGICSSSGNAIFWQGSVWCERCTSERLSTFLKGKSFQSVLLWPLCASSQVFSDWLSGNWVFSLTSHFSLGEESHPSCWNAALQVAFPPGRCTDCCCALQSNMTSYCHYLILPSVIIFCLSGAGGFLFLLSIRLTWMHTFSSSFSPERQKDEENWRETEENFHFNVFK